MVTISSLFLISNAVTTRRDKAILFSRIGIIVAIYSITIALLYYSPSLLGKGLGLFTSLLYVSSTTHSFQIFIYLLVGVILTFTAYYPKSKVFIYMYRSFKNPFVLIYLFLSVSILLYYISSINLGISALCYLVILLSGCVYNLSYVSLTSFGIKKNILSNIIT